MRHSLTFGICYKIIGQSEMKKMIILMMYGCCFLDGSL